MKESSLSIVERLLMGEKEKKDTRGKKIIQDLLLV
jgi:hypothetical protein